MLSSLLPFDQHDIATLLQARGTASATSLHELTHERLRQLVAEKGIDFTTAVLYERIRRDNAACAARIDDLYRRGDISSRLQNTAFVYVPNLGYFIDPKSQAVGEAICKVAEDLGCRSYRVPTVSTESLQANARIVCDSLARCKEEAILLMSVSKGSADVKMALRETHSEEVFRKVEAWIDVCGLSDGTPVANILATDNTGHFESQVKHWFRNRDAQVVHGILAMIRELQHGDAGPLREPLTVPEHIFRLNAVGFPTHRHLQADVSRAFYEQLAAYGPNDGYGLLCDMVSKPGAVYPIWGTDHYFHERLDVRKLASALITYTADRIFSVERPAKRSQPLPASSSSVTMPLKIASKDASRALPKGERRDDNDWERLRHARARHDGFSVGRYLQPAPMLFTRDGHNVFLGDMYRGRAAFLITSGPSLNDFDLSQLSRRGILTCAVNNAAAVHRPHLWVSVDSPGNFVDAIWRDPGIMKFVPLCHMEKHFIVRNERDELIPSQEVVGDMPAVFGYRRNERFKADQWLYEDTFNWGSHSKQRDSEGNKGSRSVMYVAIRLLFYLGIRRLYLLGCDFRMEQGARNYAFEQERSRSSVRGNNESYRILNRRMARLLPYFEREGFEVINCTPNSGLTAVPYMPFDTALRDATAEMPAHISTAGMYDRRQRERDAQKLAVDDKPDRKKSYPPKILPPPKHREPTSVEPIPEVTLVTTVDQEHLPKLALSWQTWMHHRREFASMPILLIHDESINPNDRHCDFLRQHPKLRFVSWTMPEAPSQREKMLNAWVFVPAREVETPWYLKLDADVLATGQTQWCNAAWFAQDEIGRLPAYICSPWGYTKPADAIERLDQWANAIPGLQEQPPLDIRGRPGANCVGHRRIASWCFLGNTAWTREVAAYANNRLPCPSHDTYVFYCAARRGDHVVRTRMKEHGWRHVAGSIQRLQRCCAEALALSEFSEFDGANDFGHPFLLAK